ncbi:hypothetical protein [Thermococcus sp. GR6]|uniref:hypothetical protein n=1 Tax=Thermococcus sp. GR6 TaxID=1638256 RepID=UPI0014305934|nr:hypothetical protein [Thermococcus sp. GR6]
MAKDDVELAKILMFFDLIAAIARKKFQFDGRVEGIIPPTLHVHTLHEDLELKFN